MQIAILDIVFSLDSVITAVGLADDVTVMVIAIVAAVGVMMFAAKPIGEFVDAHPTIKMLALAFLVLVGVTLIAEGFGTHVPKGYIYFAMAFSFAVEMVNIRMRKRRQPVRLRKDMPATRPRTEPASYRCWTRLSPGHRRECSNSLCQRFSSAACLLRSRCASSAGPSAIGRAAAPSCCPTARADRGRAESVRTLNRPPASASRRWPCGESRWSSHKRAPCGFGALRAMKATRDSTSV